MLNFLAKVRGLCACALLLLMSSKLAAISPELQQQLLQQSAAYLKQAKLAANQGDSADVDIELKDLLVKNKARATALSPDGNWVAAIVLAQKDWRKLVLLNSHTLAVHTLMQSPKLDSIHWRSDSRSLMIQSGDKLSVIGLEKGARARLIYRLEPEQRVIDTSGDGALISERIRPNQAYQLHYLGFDGTQSQLVASDNPVTQAWYGPNSKIQIVRMSYKEHYQFQLITADKRSTWLTCPANYRCDLVDFDPSTQTAVVLTNRFDDKLSLYRIELATGEKTLIHQDPMDWVDIRRVKQVKAGWLFGYIGNASRYYATQAGLQTKLDSIQQQLNANYFEISPADTGETLLVSAIDNRQRFPRYYLFRKQVLTEISDTLGEQANERSLSARQPIHYLASDGRLIHGYVTLPQGVDLAEAPIIAQIHGGPWTRVYPAFSSLAQLLAADGYLVFEPNFRASSGYGRDYMLAANKDFGKGRVHQDIIDGIEYLLASGLGNREKLGIMGHSFGGFSTLGALAFDPDYFQAGIATAAPHDLGKALELMAKEDELGEGASLMTIFKERVADPARPSEMKALYAKSPDAHKHKITKPLLMQAGARDRKIKVQAMKGYVASLKKLAKPVSFFVDPDVGHAFDSDMMRHASLDLYRAFWAKHLKDESLKVAKQHQDYLNRTAVFVTDAVSNMLNNQPKSE